MGYVTVQLYRDERKRPEDKWIEFIINFTAGVIERKPTQCELAHILCENFRLIHFQRQFKP